MEQIECIHGMNPEWCANCKRLKTAEEEALEEEKAYNDMLRRWNDGE